MIEGPLCQMLPGQRQRWLIGGPEECADGAIEEEGRPIYCHGSNRVRLKVGVTRPNPAKAPWRKPPPPQQGMTNFYAGGGK